MIQKRKKMEVTENVFFVFRKDGDPDLFAWQRACGILVMFRPMVRNASSACGS
jgi:hypothetical protein